jgi:sarcosine oxidase subunit gamma
MSSFGKAPELRSPLHPFGLEAQAKPVDASCGLWANEVLGQGYISLRGNAGDAKFIEAASAALAIKLPADPCTFADAGSTKVFWLSPDEWMIACPRERVAGVVMDISKALSGIRSQVTDNSGGFTQVIVQGRKAADVLAHATVYDLAHLASGRVVGTTFGKSSLYLYRHGDGYCLLLRRSFADYIWRYLVRAAEPYGFGIARLDRLTPDAKRGAA